ncbi:putative quinol monooxygenase [Helicobacter burdigaliensis]|uniref:putative quinol monooxygenase n=1 Tax=Helicobacter burdigaliensis TaxID=2315334 RepID=UPI000EF735E6|nr:antibiotic biosynthesis monooxygenase [Helicobacter burdigaliensis]
MKKILAILFLGVLGVSAQEFIQGFMNVKISEIEIDCKYLEEYKKILKEESEISVREEEGVLVLYALAHKDNPCKFSIIESYKDEESYKKHIASKHFQKYKQGTLHMIKSLKFIPMDAISPNMCLDKKF